ncbi:hypothetical protein ACEPPN_007460 [Leptodophora sp. 'Broadleaf-Isolate-01']
MQFSISSLVGLAACLVNLTTAAPTPSPMDIAAARLLHVTPGVHTSGEMPSATSNVTSRDLNKRNNGYLQVEWSFEVRDFIETLTFSQTDTIIFRWWANGDQNTQPTCQETIDVTADVGSNGQGINGREYCSATCNMCAIMDGPNPNYGATATWIQGQGVNCGWVYSPDHVTYPGFGLDQKQDYFFQCWW